MGYKLKYKIGKSVDTTHTTQTEAPDKDPNETLGPINHNVPTHP